MRPHVVSTYPQDGGIGPFNLYVPSNQTQPHFILQLNKLIDPYRFAANWLRVDGFDAPVSVELLSRTRDFTEVLAVRVYMTESRASQPYDVGRTYSVTVDTTLLDVTGNQPVVPYRFSFVPEPFFRVLRVDFSRGPPPVWPDALVRLQFNGAADATIGSSLQFEPAVQGSWSHDEGVVIFVNHEPFAFATNYALRVTDTAMDTKGNHLQAPFTTTFQVRAFEIDRTYPEDGEIKVQTPIIGVRTTGAVDTLTVPQAFSFQPATPGRFGWSPDGINFYPDGALQPSTRYQVDISTALHAWDGTPLAAPYSFSFTTDEFSIFGTYPYDGDLGVPVDAAIYVHCSMPLDPTTIPAAFTIEPAVAGTFESPTNHSFEFIPSATLAPATQYMVTISAALRAQSGFALPSPYTFSFTTASP